ncbi:MAG: hypothetical protein AAF383_01195 [Cyanobacteria bacterium P01_A01_bin.83]
MYSAKAIALVIEQKQDFFNNLLTWQTSILKVFLNLAKYKRSTS